MIPEKMPAAGFWGGSVGRPQQVIAYRCAEACGYGAAAVGDLASANDLVLVVIQAQVVDRF